MAKVIVDAFGGDNSPLEPIKGAVAAHKKWGIGIALSGERRLIEAVASENGIDLSDIEIIDAEGVIDIHENPGEILKSRKNCSMAVGLKALAAGEGDAFVSAGSTGALLMGATFLVKRIKGVKRQPFAPMFRPLKAAIFCSIRALMPIAVPTYFTASGLWGLFMPRMF